MVNATIELLSTCFYGEGGEAAVVTKIEQHEIEILEDLTTWSQLWRVWLYQRRRRCGQPNPPNHNTGSSSCCSNISDTTILKKVISLLQENIRTMEEDNHNERNNDDLMVLTHDSVVVQTNDSGLLNMDPFVTYWNDHQRYFILQEIQIIWDTLPIVDQSLVRMIVPLVDRIATGKKTSLPIWMLSLSTTFDSTASERNKASQQWPPSQIYKDFTTEQKNLTKPRETGWSTILSHNQSANGQNDVFLTWIRSRLPLDHDRHEIKCLCECLDREGSRGLSSQTIQKNIWTAIGSSCKHEMEFVERTLRQSLLDLNDVEHSSSSLKVCHNNNQRRGKALLNGYLESISCLKETKATKVLIALDDTLDFSCNTPPTNVVHHYVQDATHPNLHCLAKQLCHVTLYSPDDKRDDFLEAIRVHADWLPFSSLFCCFRTFLMESLDDGTERRHDQPVALLQRAKRMSDILLNWIGNNWEWYEIWWNWLDTSRSIIDVSLHTLHSYTSLVVNFHHGLQESIDCTHILTSCAILATLLETPTMLDYTFCFVDDSSTRAILNIFRDTHRPLTDTPKSIQRSIDDLQSSFRGICKAWQCSNCSISLGEYLRTAIEFCITKFTVGSVPYEWCRVVSKRAGLLLSNTNADLGSLWITLLLRWESEIDHLPPSLKVLHNEMVQVIWSSPQPKSFVQLLIDNTSMNANNDFVRRLLLNTLPTHSMLSHPNELPSSLTSGLKYFQHMHDPSIMAHLFLGVIYCVETILSDGLVDSNEAIQRTFSIARNFLFEQIRENRQGKESLLYYDWILEELSSTGTSIGIEWWSRLCVDLFDRNEISMPFESTRETRFSNLTKMLCEVTQEFHNKETSRKRVFDSAFNSAAAVHNGPINQSINRLYRRQHRRRLSNSIPFPASSKPNQSTSPLTAASRNATKHSTQELTADYNYDDHDDNTNSMDDEILLLNL